MINKKLYIFLFIIYTSLIECFGDYVRIHNECGYDLYGAIYYHVNNKGYERKSDIQMITTNNSAKFLIPGFRAFHYRDFIFSLNKGDLLDKLTETQGEFLGKKNIGSLTGENFYIAIDKGHLEAYNKIQWIVLKPTLDRLTPIFSLLDTTTLGMLRRRYYVSPYSQLEAGVRFGTNLSQQESNFLEDRAQKVKPRIETLLGQKLDKAPRIALCASGGGDRAMIGTLGFLKGLEKIGVLKTSTYMSALSGSSWMLAPWITSNYSLDTMQARLNRALKTDLMSIKRLGFSNIAKLSDQILEKIAFKQPVNTFADIYGFLLSDTLLKDINKDTRKIFLSDQINRVLNGNSLLPIYTSISTIEPYKWIEYTPYEIGSIEFGRNGAFIPSWAFNRQFVNGKSYNFSPPLSIGTLMAIWGSAFGVNLEELLREIFNDPNLSNFMHKELRDNMKELNINNVRTLAPEFLNYLYGLLNLPSEDAKQKPTIHFVDAGIAFNLPLPPLLRKERNIDVIIAFDASSYGIEEGLELKKFIDWAKRYDVKLPNITFETATNNCSVFTSEDPDVPIIIYLPFIKNAKYPDFDPASCIGNWCGTFNFVYTPEQIDSIVKFVEFNVISNKNIIIEAIKNKADIINKKELVLDEIG